MKMNISKTASALLDFLAKRRSRKKYGWLIVGLVKATRALLIHVGWDPPCRIELHGVTAQILLPFSHQMPMYREKYPLYDELPSILAEQIRTWSGSIRMIDVGANVGDTICSTNPQHDDCYLAFEPHPDFYPYLIANTSDFPGAKCVQLACAERKGLLQFEKSTSGTAAANNGAGSVYSVEASPLDELWKKYWIGGSVNFLKIDTDGFDVDVIRGAENLLRIDRPWLLYECDIVLTRDGLNRHLQLFTWLSKFKYSGAAVYSNTGEFIKIIGLDEKQDWQKILLTQNRAGPTRYHDILCIPTLSDIKRFLSIVKK